MLPRKAHMTILVSALFLPSAATAYLQFGAIETLEDGGLPLEVLGYSAPDCYDWDGDTLPDLIVGEGNSFNPGKIRVYLNRGSAQEHAFSGFFYVQEAGGDLTWPGG